MRRTNLKRRPCRKTCGRHQDSKRTRLIHRPCGDVAPPVGGIHVFSFSVSIVHNLGTGALVCSVALSDGAPQARGLTANAPIVQSSEPRCAPSESGHVAAASSLVHRNSVPSTHM